MQTIIIVSANQLAELMTKTPKDILIRGLRFAYRTFSSKTFLPPDCECNRQVANDMLFNLLSSDSPCMIARFGSTELNCINNYLCVKSNKPIARKWIDYVTDETHTPWWNKEQFHIMSIFSGIFPETQEIAERFSERYLQDMQYIDLLASFEYREKFMPLPSNIHKIQLEMLYPFFVDRPWTKVLEGKRVLVIHPFEQTIKQQYDIRKLIFDQSAVLPDYELITLKAVQTIAGNKSQFNDWFDALKYMEQRIDEINFDIALIGCGAYGLPLAAYCKRKGKKAVHIGGGLQLMFGILGKRWVEDYPKISPWHYLPGKDIDIDYRPIFNKYWSYPLDVDTPNNTKAVEGACYWK